MKLTFAIFLMFSMQMASALTLSEETDVGHYEVSQSLSADGEFGAADADDDPPYNWRLDFSYQRLNSAETAPSVTDRTLAAGAELGWAGPDEWSASGKLTVSKTPDENLSAVGGQLSASYRLVYGATAKPTFRPYVNFQATASLLSYTVTDVAATTRRRRRTVANATGSAELGQRRIGVDVGWKPLRAWRFGLGVDVYGYDHNVPAFEQRLDTPAALQRGLGGIANTTGSVAEIAFAARVSWEFIKDWRLNVSEQYARLAADHSLSTSTRVTVSDQVAEAWLVTLGVQRLASNTFYDTLGLIAVEYEF